MFRYKELSTLRKLILFKKLIASGIKVVSGAIASFVMKKAGKAISVLDSIEPIQEGSGTPSPTNIRPISGRTEVVTSRCDVNVWDEEWEIGGINASTGATDSSADRIRTKNFVPCKEGTSYYFACPSANWRMFFYDANKTFVSYIGTYNSARAITIPNGVAFLKFWIIGTTYNHDISINYPSTDHDYHAYNGTQYTTDLGQTVYGGTLDVVSGVLTVTHGMVDLGSLNWRISSTSGGGAPRMVGTLSDAKASSTGAELPNIYCDSYPTVTPNQTYNRVIGISNNIGGGVLIVFDPNYTDAIAFKASVNGVMCCYELATPQTIQLTPQEVELLKGQNNLWCDSGEIEVTYKG